jgi:hypothetical protein
MSNPSDLAVEYKLAPSIKRAIFLGVAVIMFFPNGSDKKISDCNVARANLFVA